jgi:hypothetical protein
MNSVDGFRLNFENGINNYPPYFTTADFLATDPPLSQQVLRTVTTDHTEYSNYNPNTGSVDVRLVSRTWKYYQRRD